MDKVQNNECSETVIAIVSEKLVEFALHFFFQLCYKISIRILRLGRPTYVHTNFYFVFAWLIYLYVYLFEIQI